MKPGAQHIFVDESGRPEVFNKKGDDLLAVGKTSKYLVIAAIRTADPQRLAREVAAAAPTGGKPRILHAVTDGPGLKSRVLTTLAGLDVVASAIVMDKTMLDPAQTWRTDPTRFYNEMLGYLLGDQLHSYARTTIVISRKDFDTAKELQQMATTIGDRHRVVLGGFSKWSGHSVDAQLRTHASSRGLQAADYIAWAVFQAFERGNMKWTQLAQPILGSIWDLGRVTRYTRKNPMTSPP
jgi:hypothetical protein